jgi:hypothetical protein
MFRLPALQIGKMLRTYAAGTGHHLWSIRFDTFPLSLLPQSTIRQGLLRSHSRHLFFGDRSSKPITHPYPPANTYQSKVCRSFVRFCAMMAALLLMFDDGWMDGIDQHR